ncbi:MAG: prephenate dehydrogenase [Ardenticatenia bacterium]|nr:MAG: prephenate dehydrogenase [Ardenticatenia bacterium]
MSQLKVSIIGTGTIGTSLGLALKNSQASVEITGHDLEHEHAGQALKMGALDHTHWNLPKAVEGADLVILATPLSAIRATLLYIAEDLRPDAVVMDVAELKKPVLAWAAEFLPDTVHFIGTNPLVSVPSRGPAGASATLFTGKRIALVPSANAKSAALDLVTNVVQVIGAEPLFISAEENDSMVAAMRQIPLMLKVAYGHLVFTSPTWREMREMVDPTFAAFTALPTTDVEELYTLLFSNRAALRHWVNALQETLSLLQAFLESDPVEEQEQHERLRQMIATLLEQQAQWETGVEQGEVERFDTAIRQAKEITSLEQLLVGRFFRHRRRKD